ncbi:MAG: putative outer membrane repeat protein, partial [Saprospiraceae bacterium]
MKDFLLKSIFILSLLCSFTSLSAQIFVNTTAPTGGDGVSWATAYRDLQPALSASQNGDEIWVAKGDYYIIGSSETSFEIPSGVKVYGGFLGNETQREQRNWGIHETNLDGASFNNTIVYFEDSNINTVLDGFTIKNGFADGASTREQSGAAIFIDITATTSSPKIANCLINDNNADSNGGAVYIDGSNSGTAAPTFENCTFENNFTLKDGGAVYSSGYSGGSCNPTFEKCSFLNNTSTVGGGALFFHGGDGNATATIKKCDFDSNIAEGNGGAIYSKGTSSGQANHIIINSIFYANQGFAAGALYNNGGDGGDCSPIITNCTFYLNEATGNGGTGGAIYNNGDNSGNSSPEISNCIIYGNIGPFDSQVFRNIDGTPTISYSLVDVADCDELNSGEGSNVTCGDGMKYNMPPLYHDPGAGNLRLLVNSPAIDFGNDSVNNETEDLDCNMRKVNNIDMGAYELPDGNLPIELADFSAYLD